MGRGSGAEGLGIVLFLVALMFLNFDQMGRSTSSFLSDLGEILFWTLVCFVGLLVAAGIILGFAAVIANAFEGSHTYPLKKKLRK